MLAHAGVAAVALAGVLGVGLSERDEAESAGSDGVEASFEMLDGDIGSLSDYGDRPLVVNSCVLVRAMPGRDARL